MIVVNKLDKKFGALQALHDVSFELAQGQWAALLGPNGAGKTTLNRILAALARPSSGRAQVAGVWLDQHPEQAREKIGVVSHQPLLYGDLSAWENLKFYAAMYAVDRPDERIAGLLQQTGLWPRRGDLVRTFSRGMQQRLALSRAMLHQPRVLLLDEPFTGLDVNATQLLTDFMQQAIHEQVTVLMTTHDVEYALTYSQRILVLVNGHLRLNQESASLQPDQVADLLRSNDNPGSYRNAH